MKSVFVEKRFFQELSNAEEDDGEENLQMASKRNLSCGPDPWKFVKAEARNLACFDLLCTKKVKLRRFSLTLHSQ